MKVSVFIFISISTHHHPYFKKLNITTTSIYSPPPVWFRTTQTPLPIPTSFCEFNSLFRSFFLLPPFAPTLPPPFPSSPSLLGMSSESKQSKQSKVTLMVEDNAPQGSSCLRNTCSTVNGSMSFSGCSLGVTNSTVALDSSASAVDQHLMYAKLSTRSATTSVQFNFDANGAMYRSTTICVEEATIRENSGDSLLSAGGGSGASSSSGSAPPPPPPALLSSGAQENLFATFRPLSTDDDDEGPPVMNRTRSVARSDSHEDPLTYFSPTVSTYVVEPKEAISISLSGGGPAPSYSKEDEEDDEDDEDEDGLDHHHHEGPLSRGPLVSLSSTDHCHVSQQGSSSKGNPLDP